MNYSIAGVNFGRACRHQPYTTVPLSVLDLIIHTHIDIDIHTHIDIDIHTHIDIDIHTHIDIDIDLDIGLRVLQRTPLW
jgi:hypothetical protein